jgi:hypothetical protein
MALNEVIQENWLHTCESLHQGNVTLVLYTYFFIGFIVRAVKLDLPCVSCNKYGKYMKVKFLSCGLPNSSFYTN